MAGGERGRSRRSTRPGATIPVVVVHKDGVYIVRYRVRSRHHAEAVSVELPGGERVYRRDEPERFQRILDEIRAEPVIALRVAESVQTG